VLPEPMTHPRSLAQAPFGYAQGRRDRCARMGHPATAKRQRDSSPAAAGSE